MGANTTRETLGGALGARMGDGVALISNDPILVVCLLVGVFRFYTRLYQHTLATESLVEFSAVSPASTRVTLMRADIAIYSSSFWLARTHRTILSTRRTFLGDSLASSSTTGTTAA